ncbi:hypothetical protein [Salinibaculum salinum]|uniref:hypothetical protein n=1 Tax=Salinibaculum salinum TaxID=3131996 RepID=UPI0030EE32B9
MSGQRTNATHGAEIPETSPGLTLLKTEGHRSTALHRMAHQTVRNVDGIAYWIDARNTASTYALYDIADHDRLLRRIRLARAFTAYQHYSLVKRLINSVTPRTGCLIVPNMASLYRDDDVPDHEARQMLSSAVSSLEKVCTTYDIRLLVTAAIDDELTALIADHASAEYRSEQTPLGYRFEGEGFETTVFWDNSGWQTTIPYWVEMFGTVTDEVEAPGIGPITPARLGDA